MTAVAEARNPMLSVFTMRNFRLLFAGVSTSLLGDQFTLIATPWLVLQLTRDPGALGLVLALEGVPRALFMLFGGAFTDRVSPRVVLLIADLLRGLLAALLCVVVFSGTVQMWMLYAFSLAFGLVAGFAVPAGNSIVPSLVKQDDLEAANALVMGVGQLAGIVGPVVAGLLIGRYAESLTGIGLAFGIDSLTFAVSAASLLLMQAGVSPHLSEDDQAASIFEGIKEGLAFVWNDEPMRQIFTVIAAINFLFVGPILVGIPVLADQRLPEGAAAFGLLMSGFAVGNLAGYGLAGALPKPSGSQFRLLLVVLLTAFGIAMGVVGLTSSTWADFALMLMLGLGIGYVTILFFSWIQLRAPSAMLGRIMSLLMLASAGLIPISQAVSGFVSTQNPTLLFVVAGVLFLLLMLRTSAQPGFTAFCESVAEGRASET